MTKSDDNNPQPPSSAPARRAGINIAAFLLVAGFVWIVFDNLALGLLFGLAFAAGGEVVQRSRSGKRERSDDQDKDRRT
jgi:hypothetical protein